MLNKKKFTLVLILFLIYPINLFSKSEVIIVTKIDDQIITNFDITQEANYLIALNNNLENIEKSKILKFAKDSLIKETIKKKELLKYFDLNKDKESTEKYLLNIYKDRGFQTIEEFDLHLKKYKLNLNDVRKKLIIEIVWNEFIFLRYKNRIEIDEESLKKKIKMNQEIETYLLYDIIFNAENNKLIKKKTLEITQSISNIGFRSTASLYSLSNSKKNQGKLGWVNENELSDIILNELRKTEVGQSTNPIAIPGGVLILFVEDKKKQKIEKDFETELKKIIVLERNRQYNQYSTIYFKKIKNNFNIYEQ